MGTKGMLRSPHSYNVYPSPILKRFISLCQIKCVAERSPDSARLRHQDMVAVAAIARNIQKSYPAPNSEKGVAGNRRKVISLSPEREGSR